MNSWGLVWAGLRHYRRTHLGVTVGFALGAAVLVGALLVGDSVRGSLRDQALARIGSADVVLALSDRHVRAALATDLEARIEGARAVPALRMEGHASADGGARRVNGLQVLGVERSFFDLSPGARPPNMPVPGEVLVSRNLATRLGVDVGETVLVRVEKPSALPRDMILAQTEDSSVGLRMTVSGIVRDESFGRFALDAAPLPPANAFVPLDWLQSELELEGRANLILIDGPGEPDALAEVASAALRAAWSLDDGELELLERDGGWVELRSPRVFLDDAVAQAAAELNRPTLGVLTYLVNELRYGENAVPYSTVAALGSLGDAGGLDELLPPELLPPDLAADQLVINDWVANDLGVAAGDVVQLSYYVPGPDRRLEEQTRAMTVRAVTPMQGLAGDADLMPAFPGLEGAANCREWEPGIPMDLEQIRPVDEAYWDDHAGTPKAFLSLTAGRELWASRFGTLTAVRTPGPAAEFEHALKEALDPAKLGLFFTDLAGPALAGSKNAMDFGGLFLGLSFFLITAALLLSALLFVFGVEQRSAEIGTLLAVGFPPRRVRRLFFGEAALLALVGTVVGTALGVQYTKAVLHGLSSVWSGAVGSTTITYHSTSLTVFGGALGAWLVALGATYWALRGQVRHTALELLMSSEGVAPQTPATAPRSARVSLGIAGVSGLAAVGIGLFTDPSRGPAAAGAFFGGGSALLIAALALSRFWLVRLGAGQALPRSVSALGRRNGGRRPGRSLATVILLASGTFLVVSIGAHRKSGDFDAESRTAGTGGFAFVGGSTLPVHHDLNDGEGREAFGLDEDELAGVSFVPLRVHEGDDASCLNLGSPQNPRLVGVDPAGLAERGAFAFASAPGADELDSPWRLLGAPDPEGALPAIGDQASVTWTLHKKIGDLLDYVDERGRAFQVRIVATVADSILQGNLLVAEPAFQERFPSDSGYRMFLVDAPPERAEEVGATLGRALRDVGLELVPASERLDEFHTVQNTYLDIFQVLGALGVLLGSVGVGVVVLRNALERRAELAVLGALGFSRGALRNLLLGEHVPLIALGLLSGTVAALLALVPVASSAGAENPLTASLPLVAALVVNGLLWVVLASAVAVRGDQLAALRSE